MVTLGVIGGLSFCEVLQTSEVVELKERTREELRRLHNAAVMVFV